MHEFIMLTNSTRTNNCAVAISLSNLVALYESLGFEKLFPRIAEKLDKNNLASMLLNMPSPEHPCLQ